MRPYGAWGSANLFFVILDGCAGSVLGPPIGCYRLSLGHRTDFRFRVVNSVLENELGYVTVQGFGHVAAFEEAEAGRQPFQKILDSYISMTRR